MPQEELLVAKKHITSKKKAVAVIDGIEKPFTRCMIKKIWRQYCAFLYGATNCICCRVLTSIEVTELFY